MASILKHSFPYLIIHLLFEEISRAYLFPLSVATDPVRWWEHYLFHSKTMTGISLATSITRRGCGVVRRRHRRGSGRSSGGRGRLNVNVPRHCDTGRRLGHFRLNCRGRGNQRFPRLVPCDVARVHDPSRLRVHDFYTVASVVVAEV